MESVTDKNQTKALILDTHFDLAMDICDRRDRKQQQVFETTYAKNFRKSGLNAVISSLFVHDHFVPELALRKALDQISMLHAEMDESPQQFCLCRTTTEIRRAADRNELAVLLSFEGVEPLGNDLSLLRIFYELGVRGLGLVWSRRNYAADGCIFGQKARGRNGGLTDFGIKLIEESIRLGMYVDVSHLNDEGFWDVIELVDGPVIASHSNCRSLAPSMRNLTDDQIRAIAAKGGLIGMNALSLFVGDHDKSGTLTADSLVDHVDHIRDLVGVEHVAMGFDFNESFVDYMNMGWKIETYDVIKGHGHLSDFTEALSHRGYTPKQIRLIQGENAMRFLKETIG